jgi:phenylacetate-coenzyme A ligase PaaK-like adenylate-forming protein
MTPNLDETLRYAAKHSPFYREAFRELKGIPRFEDVPIIDKRTLSERNLDFLCVPRERVAEIVTTSGTTGHPILYMLTDADLRRLGENERQSFECAGLTASDTVLVAVTLDRCFIAGLAYWLGLRQLGLRRGTRRAVFARNGAGDDGSAAAHGDRVGAVVSANGVGKGATRQVSILQAVP